MEITEIKYYNAKPSNISNLGQDLKGAKRHNFDTYENPEEKKKKQQHNKMVKGLKESLKLEVLKDEPNPLLVSSYLIDIFLAEYGFNSSLSLDEVKLIIIDRQAQVSNLPTFDRAEWAKVDKLRNAFNKVRKQVKYISNEYYAKYELRTLKKRYQPKDSYKETNGKTVDWKTFKTEKEVDLVGLEKTTKAIQFGNTVTDSERAYILNEMLDFLDCWNFSIPTVNLFDIGWSFGARGNAQSVAYYQHKDNIISVNRNNIGSLIHEIGHFLDYRANIISSEIPSSVVREYRAKVEANGATGSHLRYLLNKKEIFARAFEAYCLKHFSFSIFAQWSGDDLPVLCPVLEGIIKKALTA